MKKIFLSLSILFFALITLAQNPVIVNRASQANTVQDARLAAQYNFIPPRYVDTIEANTKIGLDSCGALIFTRDGKYWLRNCSPVKKWVLVIVDTSLLVHKAGNETITGVKTFIPDQIISTLTVGRGLGTNTNSTALGLNALSSNVSGTYSTAIGKEALKNLKTGLWNTAVGALASSLSTEGNYNTAIGTAALINNLGNYNTGLGIYAGQQSRRGTGNTLLGFFAMKSDSTGSYNVVVGGDAGGSNAGTANGDTLSRNVFIGYQTARQKSRGKLNVYIGFQAGYNAQDSDSSVFIGPFSGYNETGKNKLYIDNTSTSTPLIYGDMGVGKRYIKINGGFATSYVAKTATYTILSSDYTIHCTANTFTVTLPAAASLIVGQIFIIKNTGAGTITLQGNGAENIDSSNTQTISPNNSLRVQNTGTGFIII